MSRNIGQGGEALVANWLGGQGWVVLHQNWYGRGRALDVIARHPEHGLAFVEVKTRSQGSWDADGLLAINAQKQRKLLHATRLFLAQHPQLAELPCRFDVALVSRVKLAGSRNLAKTGLANCEQAGYYLTLHTYLEGAYLAQE